ncbi:MAG: HEAT repeat domain-containing protein [Cyanobacteriota bacterium]|nr:HEAT repeat domain-containing protein [Cyanobacteriota bacterium]
MSEPKTQSQSETTLSAEQQLAQEQTDALLQRVHESLATQTFDSSDQQTLKQMVESFSDSRGMTRLTIAETLGEIGKPATSVLLEGLANHPNPVVRRACAKTLTLIEDPDAIPTLINALGDEDTVVQASCAGALARLGEPAVSPLLSILETSAHSESIKGYVSWALAFMGPQIIDPLCEAFNSDSGDVRMAVVGAITNIIESRQDEKLFNLLTTALQDSVEDVRCEAMAVLGSVAHQPAIPQLIELLSSTSEDTRKAAALALMKIGDPVALDPLKTAIAQESDLGTQQALQLAISQLEK